MRPAGGTSPAPVIVRPNPPVEIPAEEIEEKASPAVTVKTSGVVVQKTSGVRGMKKSPEKPTKKCPLPSMKNYAWEAAKTSGAWECWFTPEKVSERGGKTYVGYVGKKLLAEWLSESEDKAELRQLVAAWIGEKEAAKGNSLTRVRPPQKPKNHREKRGEL